MRLAFWYNARNLDSREHQFRYFIYLQRLSVTLPDGISGNYYVLVFADDNNFNPPPSGLVLEFQDEGNNIAAQPLPITLTNPPDLQVTNITVPTHVTASQILDVSWTVTNEASGDTPPRQAIWNDYVYLSEDTHLERLRDRFLGLVRHVGGLAAGGNYDVTQSYRLGASLDGLFYVIVSTDPPWGTYNLLRGDVFELDRENNNTLASDPLVIERPPPADVQVDSVSIPATAQTGAPVRVTWTASNHGQFPASGSWTDSVYLSADDTWSLDDVPLGKVAHYGSLANGQGYDGSLDATLPSVRDGNYRVIVRADLFDEVYEGTVDEQNNVRAAPGALVVSVPPLRLNVVENTSLSTDQGRLYRLDVAANQTIRLRLTTSAAEAANEIYVRYGDAPSALVHDFSHSGPLQANQELLIPGTQAGVYYVLVRGQSEPTAHTPIQLLAEALPFQITDIVQDKGGDSRYVTATILGAQFAPNAIVKLVRPGFAELEPVRYQVLDGTKIIAVFDFRNAPHGLYDVTVINPNGDQANLPYRFLVEQAIEPDLVIGLGGTRVLWAGQTGYYGLSVINATNVDLPYVQVEVGVPEQGLSPLGPRYTTFSNNLSGTAQVPDVPWASLDSTFNTSGFNEASGYVLDLVNRGFAGFNFTAMTYLGPATSFPEEGYPPPRLIGFTYQILAAATPLTPAEFVEQQRAEAEKLRQAILADTTATPALRVLAADADSWASLYLTALQQAGILRPEDTPPAASTEPVLNSLMSVLAAGILAGPGGGDILAGGDLLGFFAKIHQWYGDQPGTIYAGSDPHNLSAQGQPLPDAATFDLQAAARTHFQAFPVYVRFANKSGRYFPDQPDFQEATPLQLQQLLAGQAQEGQATLQGPLGQGLDQFVPTGQPLPFTLQFENPASASSHVAEATVVTQLDEDVDPFSFRVGDMRLGDITVHIPDERGSFQREFDFRQSKGFILRVTAGIDLPTRTATWNFQAIDPDTGEVIQDPNRGLLPPSVNGSGAGFVSWTVEANRDAVTGSKIEASGRVLLNNAPPQVSNIVTCSIDSVAPATSLTATPLEPGSSNYNVQWQATDDEPAGVGLGSGVRHVTVYVSEDGGEYRIWLKQTSDTQGVYRGQVGHTYTFLALATDNAGNKETPPLGASAPDDGSGANLGALPTVASSSPDDDPPPAPPPPQVLPPSPLFVLAQQGVPSASPATKPGEYQTVLRPFTVNAFATGIGESRAGIGPMAIVELPDGSFVASGGSGRNQLFHLTREGGAAGGPLATLSQPVFALAMDSQGRLWAATGGGPLLQLDPSSGAILGQFGDSVTQAVAVDPASGKVFVSSGKGIEIFDPATGRFSHFSDERVGNLAFALDGTLWGARWPNRGAVLRFNNKGKAETITRFDAPIDSLAFGRAGTKLEGLLFVTSNQGELFLVDVNTRQQLIVARGGSRGDVVTATGDGRILLSQSHQIDVFKPLVAPRVLSVNPPPDVTVPLPLASISVTFDQDMLTLNPTDPRSVLNPRNYRLQGDSVGPIQLIQLQAVAYDRASRTAVLTFEPLAPGPYQLRVLEGLNNEAGLALGEEYRTAFTAISDLTSVLDLRFTQSRSDRESGTISFDVTVTNNSGHRLLLPLILQLSPTSHFDGEPLGPAGRAADGTWLIDLSENFPSNGILERGQSTSGRTVTVRIPSRRPVTFDPSVAGLPSANSLPVILTYPLTSATAAQIYQYQASAFDENGDDLSYLLVRGPDGMTVDANTGLVTWTPSATSPEHAEVVLQVYDSAGARDTQAFLLQVVGVNRQPVLSTLPPEIQGTEGKLLEILVQALDPEDDPLVYWSDHLPPGAVFDAARKMLVWTPTYQDAGTYENVTLAVSDGLHTVLGITTLVIAPSAPALTFPQPPDVVVREGDPVTVQLQASDAQGLPLTFSGNLLPPGSSLDPQTGLFTWTPDYTQNGLHVAPVTVSNGETEATQILGIVVLNVNAPPVFANLDTYEGIEGQEVQIRADARDPDNLLFTPPDRAADGSLIQEDPGVSTLVVSASNLPTGATFDPVTQMLQWTPEYDAAGLHSVTFTATDDGDNTGIPQTTTKTVVLHIGNVNRAPLVPVFENQTVQRGTTLELPIQTTDLDGDPLVLTVSGLPRFGSFVDHGDGTGLLRFTPDYGDRGNYAITLRATDDGDGGGVTQVLFDQRSFVLAAQSANESPHLDWIGDKVAVVDSPLQFTLRVSDLDQGPLSFTADGLPSGATITPSPIYGRAAVQWTPTVTDIGTHTVTFHVNDDGNGNANLALADQRTIDLVVRAANAGPSLSAIDSQVIAEGQTLVVTPSATDPDGDTLTWSVANLPPGATVDPVQGILSWTPEVFQRGNYPGITITASDGNQSSSQTFAIGVAKTNQPPVLFPMAEQIGRENVQLKFSLAANDFDGDAVTFVALSALPLGAQLNSQSGQFQWTPTFNQAGIYTLRVEARDSEGLGSTRDIPLRILNVNRPPTLQVSNRSALLGESFHFALAAQDPDAGTVFTYAASGLPPGATLNPQTGVFDWTPGVGQIGAYVVSFSASDGETTAQGSAELRALVTRPPLNLTIELTPSFPVLPGQGVLIHLATGSFSTLTGLTLKVDGQPVTLDAQSRGQFTPAAPGRILVEASATNVDSQVGQASTILKVRDPADQTAPVVTLDGTLSGVRLTTITDILGSINDSNLDSWVLEAALSGSDRFVTLAQGNVAVTGTLARFDPSTVLNGVYRLRLTAMDIGGRSAQTEVVVEANTSAKPTQYLGQATDLTVQLGGITVNLVRAYDSFSRETAGSFGNGWRLANRDTDIQTSVPPTGHEQTGIFNPFRQGTRVYLNLPDGRRIGFTFTPEKHELLGVTYYTPAFQADPGIDWRLDSAQTKLTRGPDGFYDLQTARPYHPANSWFVGPEYTLTGPDGTIYLLSTARGVEQQRLPNGTRLVFTDNGIISSTGERVQFVRDAAGRVTTLEGPDGSRLVYSYDNRGNLTTVRNAGTGQSSRFGYATDDPHLLTLFTTPDPQGGYTIQYGATLHTFPVGIDLGSADQFLTNVVHGSLAAGVTGRLAFSLRPSEMRSIPTGTVLMGVEVHADTGSALEPAVPVLPGFTPLLQRAGGGSAFALFAVNRDGLNLLEVRGKTPNTFGGFVLRVFVAGDANADGAVDGVDGNIVAAAMGSTAGQAGYSIAADGNLDGVIDATDVQLVGSNLGFMANRPPLAQPGEVLTHVDLPLPVDLTVQAHDREGDPVFFRVVGAEHGTATLNPDGHTVTFIPEAGYSGQGDFQFLADDGYGQSPITTITVDVSAAPLVNLDFQNRNFRLSQGRAGQAVMIGDFADQQDVVLDPSYVTFVSTAPDVATVSSQGHLQALADGTGILLVTSHGVQAASAITVGIPQDVLGKQLYDVGLDPFPLALSLSSHGGSRQFAVHPNGDIDLQTDLGPSVSGTHYYVNRPGVATITSDGLITGQAAGTITVTIINGSAETVIPVLVEEPRTGQVELGAAGGVVQGADGSIVAVAPGSVPEETPVSIAPLTLGDLPQGLPEFHAFAAAFQLDIGPETLDVPVQLAVPVDPSIPAGSLVYFYRAGETLDDAGHFRPIWWQVESGIVGADHFARTNTPPQIAIRDGGTYLVSWPDKQRIGELQAKIHIENALNTLAAFSIAVAGAGDTLIGTMATVASIGITATLAMPALPQPTPLLIQAIPQVGLPELIETGVQIDKDKINHFETTIILNLPAGATASTAPVITFAKVDILDSGPELTLNGSRFLEPSPPLGAPALSDLRVLFTLPNGQKYEATPTSGSDDTLHVPVPAGVILGAVKITVRRPDQVKVAVADGVGKNGWKPETRDSFSNAVQIDPGGSYVFVALPEARYVTETLPDGTTTFRIDGQLGVIDGSDPTAMDPLIARIPVGSTFQFPMPRSVAVTPDNTRAYVTLRGAPGIAVVDALTLQQIDVSAAPPRSATGGLPHVTVGDQGGVAIDPAMRFATLTKPTDIYGTVKVSGATSWKLEIALWGTTDFTPVGPGGNTSVDSKLLGVVDPTGKPDGTYLLRLTAEDGSTKPPKSEMLVEFRGTAQAKEIKLPKGTMPYSIVIDDAGHFAYVTEQPGRITGDGEQYSAIFVIDVNPASPTFNQLVNEIKVSFASVPAQTATPLIAPTGLRQMVVSPDGSHLFVAAPNFLTPSDPGAPNPFPSLPNFAHLAGNLIEIDLALDKNGVPVATQFQAIPGAAGTYGVARVPTDDGSNDVAFTNSESDGVAVIVTHSAEESKQTIPLNLQYPTFDHRASEQFLQVHSANGIVFSPDGRYAFVAGKADIVNNKFFVQQDETPRYTGGNIGIIKDPLGPNPQLVAATRPVPFGQPNDLTISPDGQYLYVGYQGIEVEVRPPVIEQQPDPNHPGQFIDVVIVPGKYARGGVMIFDVAAMTDLIDEIFAQNKQANLHKFPIDDVVFNGTDLVYSPQAPNATIDVHADYRLDMSNLNESLFRVFDVTRAPIATGGRPGGIAMQRNLLNLKSPLNTNIDVGVWDENSPAPTKKVWIDEPIVFTWDVGGAPGVVSRVFVSTVPGGHGLFPSDYHVSSANPSGTDLNAGRIVTDGLGTWDNAAGEFLYELPADTPLTASQMYYWGVEATMPDGTERRSWTSFRTNPVPAQAPDLFSSVIVITHGTQTPYVDLENPSAVRRGVPEDYREMAAALARTGSGLVFEQDSRTGAWAPAFPADAGKTPGDALGKPLILLVNWVEESAITDAGFVEAVGDAVFADLVALDQHLGQPSAGPAGLGKLLSSPLHFIGVGRGAVVNTEITQRLDVFYPAVGRETYLQTTTLDPQDFNQPSRDVSLGAMLELIYAGDFAGAAQLAQTLPRLVDTNGSRRVEYGDSHDSVITPYDNVTFADNYYEALADLATSTSFVPDGRSVPEADLNLQLDGSNRARFSADGPDLSSKLQVLDTTDPDVLGLGDARLQVKSWYTGTLDLSLSAFDGDLIWRRLADQDPSDGGSTPWYLAGEAAGGPAVDAPTEGIVAGWFYSILGGGINHRPPVNTAARQPGSYDNTWSAVDGSTDALLGDAPVPTVFNGDFNDTVNPWFNRFPIDPGQYQLRLGVTVPQSVSDASTGTEIPGWSFQNGLDNDPAQGDRLMDLISIQDFVTEFAAQYVPGVAGREASTIAAAEQILGNKGVAPLKYLLSLTAWQPGASEASVQAITNLYERGLVSNAYAFAIAEGDTTPDSLTHDRMYIPPDATDITFDTMVADVFSGSDGQLNAYVTIDPGQASEQRVSLGSVLVDEVTKRFRTNTLPLPQAAQGHEVTLSFDLVTLASAEPAPAPDPLPGNPGSDDGFDLPRNPQIPGGPGFPDNDPQIPGVPGSPGNDNGTPDDPGTPFPPSNPDTWIPPGTPHEPRYPYRPGVDPVGAVKRLAVLIKKVSLLFKNKHTASTQTLFIENQGSPSFNAVSFPVGAQVTISIDGPADRFLNATGNVRLANQTFHAKGGETFDFDSKDYVQMFGPDGFSQLTRDQLYGSTITIDTVIANKDGSTFKNTQKIRVARWITVVDASGLVPTVKPGGTVAFSNTLADGAGGFVRTKNIDIHGPEDAVFSFVGVNSAEFRYGLPVHGESTAEWKFDPHANRDQFTKPADGDVLRKTDTMTITLGGDELGQLTVFGRGTAPTTISVNATGGANGEKGFMPELEDVIYALRDNPAGGVFIDLGNGKSISASQAFISEFTGYLPQDRTSADGGAPKWDRSDTFTGAGSSFDSLDELVRGQTAKLLAAVAPTFTNLNVASVAAPAYTITDGPIADVVITWAQSGPDSGGQADLDVNRLFLQGMLESGDIAPAAKDWALAEALNQQVHNEASVGLFTTIDFTAPGITFAEFVANTVSHEIAHTFGILDSYFKSSTGFLINVDPPNDIMRAGSRNDPFLSLHSNNQTLLQAAMGMQASVDTPLTDSRIMYEMNWNLPEKYEPLPDPQLPDLPPPRFEPLPLLGDPGAASEMMTGCVFLAQPPVDVGQAAIAYWASSLGKSAPFAVEISVADLPSRVLAQTYINGVGPDGLPNAATLVIDRDAAGLGWFVDDTPGDRSEFGTQLDVSAYQAAADSPAAGKYDLLSVLLHETGHLLGFNSAVPGFAAHVGTIAGSQVFVAPELTAVLSGDGDHLDSQTYPNDLMNATLPPSVRRLPSPLDVQILNIVRGDPATPDAAEFLSQAASLALSERLSPFGAVFALFGTDGSTRIQNGDFAVTDTNAQSFAWDTSGSVSAVSGEATLSEDPNVLSGLSQTFTIPAGATGLQFTITATNFVPNSQGPLDAFEVALLDAITFASLVGTAAGLGQTSSLLNIQQTGEVFFGPQVTVPGMATSGQSAQDFLFTVTVDLSGVAAGTEATLFFDLLGFGASGSSISLDNVVLLGDLPPRLQLELDGASDSGLPNDSLTNLTSVRLVGTTDPIQAVLLDINGDGFNDGNTTADAFGDFNFDDVPLAEGANQIRVQATNQQGANVVTRTITLDTQRPTGQLVDPEPDTAILQDPGFVVVQWTDSGAAGLDPATLGVGDIAISGVTVDRIEDLGNGLVRYHYNDDGDALPGRLVDVVLVPGEVADRAGNANLEKTQSFVLITLPPLPSLTGPMTGLEGSLVELVGSAVDRSGANSPIRLDWTVAKNGAAFAAGTGGEIRFTPDDDGMYLVTLTATDQFNRSDRVERTVTVANVAPTPSITGPNTVLEGEPVSLVGSALDPAGDNDTVTLVWSVDKNGTQFAQGTGSDIAFTPDDNGVFEVTLTASDEDGGSASVTRTVDVSNVSPQASITGPTQGQEGSAVSLNAFATDPGGANDPISFAWSITKQGTPFTAGAGPAISFTPDDNGRFEVTLTATDDEGASDTSTHTVDVANVAPTPSITGPATGSFAEPVSLTGSATDPAGANDVVSLAWSVTREGVFFSDGTGGAIQFTPDATGLYRVTLAASDEDGGSSNAEHLVNVLSIQPAPSIAGPATGLEGRLLSFAGTSASTGESVTFSWTVAKGSAPFATGTGSDIQFTPDDNGSFVITLTATNSAGSTSVSRTVAVANVAPTPLITGPATGREGEVIEWAGSATDPAGANDTVNLLWSVTRGGLQVASGSGTSFQFRPGDDGQYMVTLIASDEDGGSASTELIVSVDNVAPTASLSGPTSGVEGSPLTLLGSATDPAGSNDILTFTWLVAKDGRTFASGSGRNIRFTPDNNGLYQVTLTVSDEDGGVDAIGQEVTVANVAPVIADLTNNAAQAGVVALHEPVSITATFTDVGLFDTHTARLDWGDGSLQEPATILESHGSGTIAASHAYSEGGLYTISLVLSDQDGGEDTAQTQAFLPGARRHDRELQIVGGQGNDIVTVTPSGTTRMFVNVTLQGSGNVRQFYNLVDVDLIRIYVDGGNDRVMVSDRLAIPSVIFGGPGDDHLQGGDGYNLIVGGAGDDTILGGDERDVLIGGTGADQLFGYGGEDVLLGGPANNGSAELETILDVWISDALFDDRVARILDLLNLAADASQDDLYGSGGVDLVFPSLPDSLINDTTSISYSVPEAEQAGWLEPVVGVPGVYRTVVDPETESGAVKGDFLWTNPRNPLDVNDDQWISPLDALIVINDLNQYGPRLLDDFFAASLADRFYLDTSGDGRVSPLDALLIINELNRGEQPPEPGPSALAEGESTAAREVEFVPYVLPQTSLIGNSHQPLPARRRGRLVDAVHQADPVGWSRPWPVDDRSQGGRRTAPVDEVLCEDGTSDLELALSEIAEDVLRCWLDNDGGAL